MQKLFLLGDSITAGYYESEITDLLTKRIQQALPKFEVVNAGIPGDTTVDGLARLEDFVLRYEPTYVTVFFGANDVALHNELSVEEYQENLKELIDQIGPKKVVLLSTPYGSQRNPSVPAIERLREFTEGAETVALELGLPFINLLDEMIKTGQPESLLQADGLHFSLTGYDFLAEQIVTKLNQIITEKE